jgi:hypothetical protein
MNYAELFETIKGYVENDFPNTSWTGSDGSSTVTLTSTEQINTFIQEAEQRIFNAVQLLDLRKNVTGNMTAGNKYLAVPTDWLANFSMAVIDDTGRYEYLLNKDVSFIRQSFPNPNDEGIPTHYAYFDENSYILGPTPDENYAVELHYFYVTARGALIYNTTPSANGTANTTLTNASVAVLDFGSDKTSTAGDFTIIFPTNNNTSAIIRIA